MIWYAATAPFCSIAGAFPLISLMDYEQGKKKKKKIKNRQSRIEMAQLPAKGQRDANCEKINKPFACTPPPPWNRKLYVHKKGDKRRSVSTWLLLASVALAF